MSDAETELFDVYFAGECLEGHDAAAVRAALGRLFKADEATLERLFSGSRQILKRGCDKAAALTYQKALTGAGAKPVITRARGAASTAAGPASAPAPAELELAPLGSDVLAPGERRSAEPSEIATEHLSIADVGSALSDPAPAPPAASTAPDLDLAEPGSRLAPESSAEPAPPPPDTTSIELTPAGHTLEDCAAPLAAAPQVSLEHLDIAPAGSDLLAGSERREPVADAPDTSHLQLQTLEDDR